MMSNGALNLVLHAHLPYVRHPELDVCLEENWLFEAITECYLPLLAVFRRLQTDAVPFRLTLSLSPTLLAMLADRLLQQRYQRYLQQVIGFAEQECQRYQARGQTELLALAQYHVQRLQQAQHDYLHTYQGDLIAAFAAWQRSGQLQLMTCAATHGFLPLLNSQPNTVKRQIQLGLQSFAEHFGFLPQGFWLPECAYYPGLEQVLADQGIRYFYLESHALTRATPPAEYAVYAPVNCGNGVFALARDPMSSAQVWSAQGGYPGHADYLDFHSDAGTRVPVTQIPNGILAEHTGCKYWRVTGGEGEKALYQPQQAAHQAIEHAEHFVASKRQQLQELQAAMPHAPLIVAPFDAELFGHWWHEGPLWLEAVLRLAAEAGLTTMAADDYGLSAANLPVCHPAASSWGENGYNEYWLNDSNRWIYPLLDKAAGEFERLLSTVASHNLSELQGRAISQALRELLLAQASDWPFLIHAGTAKAYAEQAVYDRLARFNYLMDSLRKNRIDERQLTALEIIDAIFPELTVADL